MAFDGNGNWISTFSAVADRDAGIKILATRFDNIFINDIAQSFENCLTKDGQVKTQVNFDLNNNRLINVVDPINEYDGANKAYVDYCIAHVEQDPLFAFKWADYEIADQSWLRADTFSWQDGTVYTNAYSHLVADVEDVNTTTEVVAGYTITYYPCADGHKIVTPIQESVVQNIYDATGVAWYYVLDQANQRFKLPRTKYGFTGVRDTVGKYVPESLPQHTHNYQEWGRIGGGGVGYDTYNHPVYYDETRETAGANNSTYQDNAPVQQRATQMYLYFYVGNFTQTATEQTAGLNSELFNGKLDLDAGNATSSTKETIVDWGMPSETYENISLGSSGVQQIQHYTAPADGYVFINSSYFGQNSAFIRMTIRPSGDPIDSNYYAVQYTFYSGWGVASLVLPVKKGADVELFYTMTWGADSFFRFIYAQGEA